MPQKTKKKRSLLEAINPFDKESKDRRLMRKGRRAGKKAAKATRGMTGFDSPPAKTAKKKLSISSALKARRMKRKAAKINKPLKRAQAGKAAKGTGLLSTKKSRVKAVGAKAGTQVRRKAVKAVKSKAKQDYVKYEKKSKAAGSFRSAFKSGCAGGAKGFSWDGRSYSCSKAGPKKAKKAVQRGGQGGSAPE
jgi:hypothetical protein